MPRAPKRHDAAPRRRGEDRPNSYQRGYTKAWQRYRLQFLAEHPLCKRCLRKGRSVPATDVDHIKPHRGNEVLFWDARNHQALCKSCHSRKTATEDGGYGRSLAS